MDNRRVFVFKQNKNSNNNQMHVDVRPDTVRMFTSGSSKVRTLTEDSSSVPTSGATQHHFSIWL